MKNKGLFIVIDGADGSGKATQAQKLHEAFSNDGHDAMLIDFPRYNNNHTGKLIRECLDGKRGNFLTVDPKIASVLYAVDRFESSRHIRDHIEKGGIVIADRYVSANQIHQGGKISDEQERRDFMEWLERLEYEIMGIPKPDLILYLYVPVEISQDLVKKRSIEKNVEMDIAEKDLHHQHKTRESALSIIKDNNNWIKIECSDGTAMRSREDIHDEIKKIVLELHGSR